MKTKIDDSVQVYVLTLGCNLITIILIMLYVIFQANYILFVVKCTVYK